MNRLLLRLNCIRDFSKVHNLNKWYENTIYHNMIINDETTDFVCDYVKKLLTQLSEDYALKLIESE